MSELSSDAKAQAAKEFDKTREQAEFITDKKPKMFEARDTKQNVQAAVDSLGHYAELAAKEMEEATKEANEAVEKRIAELEASVGKPLDDPEYKKQLLGDELSRIGSGKQHLRAFIESARSLAELIGFEASMKLFGDQELYNKLTHVTPSQSVSGFEDQRAAVRYVLSSGKLNPRRFAAEALNEIKPSADMN